jgi:hypothetical protein
MRTWRKIGFAANRRLLDVQRIGHDCFIGEAAFQDMQKPVTVGDQRAAALRFADPRVQALLQVLQRAQWVSLRFKGSGAVLCEVLDGLTYPLNP